LAPTSETLTLSTALYVIFGGACAAFFTWAANWANKRSEYRRLHRDNATAAEIQADSEERRAFRLAQQELNEALRKRIRDSEDDRTNLWKEFQVMQAALASTQVELRMAQGRADDCELLHRADAMRISYLENDNLILRGDNVSLHERITVLENKADGQ
jgi:hypothetical protein